MPTYWGPHKIVERPSHSTVKVKVGNFANGAENIQTHHWSNLKPAEMREDTPEAVMPRRGRPSKSTVSDDSPSTTDAKTAARSESDNKKARETKVNKAADRPAPTRRSERILARTHATSSVEFPQLSPNPQNAGNSNLASQQNSNLSTRPWSASIAEVIDLNKQLERSYRGYA